ncbi:hypothetical protein ACEXP9_21685, partial [Bacillus amyloliquefaciens]
KRDKRGIDADTGKFSLLPRNAAVKIPETCEDSLHTHMKRLHLSAHSKLPCTAVQEECTTADGHILENTLS